MSTTALKGNPVELKGELPTIGSKAPDFLLTKNDLSDVTLKDFAGKKIVLNISPASTQPCAQPRSAHSTRPLISAPMPSYSACRWTCPLPRRASAAPRAQQCHHRVRLSHPHVRSGLGVLIADGPLQVSAPAQLSPSALTARLSTPSLSAKSPLNRTTTAH